MVSCLSFMSHLRRSLGPCCQYCICIALNLNAAGFNAEPVGDAGNHLTSEFSFDEQRRNNPIHASVPSSEFSFDERRRNNRIHASVPSSEFSFDERRRNNPIHAGVESSELSFDERRRNNPIHIIVRWDRYMRWATVYDQENNNSSRFIVVGEGDCVPTCRCGSC
jgi:hypothetical protein